MGTPEDVLDLSIIYLRVYFLGITSNLLYNTGAAILRAVGDSRRPLYILMASCGTNIILENMLSGASSRTLVLIDEFGTGTEPIMGGAIAEAILEQLVERGTYGVITTHYSNIKYFASNHEGVENGAMMFDVQNIRPLFRLEMEQKRYDGPCTVGRLSEGTL